MAWDITVPGTFAESHLSSAAAEQGADKTAKYQGLEKTHLFSHVRVAARLYFDIHIFHIILGPQGQPLAYLHDQRKCLSPRHSPHLHSHDLPLPRPFTRTCLPIIERIPSHLMLMSFCSGTRMIHVQLALLW